MLAKRELVDLSLRMDMCYESKKLKEHEHNYATHDLELVAIMRALNM